MSPRKTALFSISLALVGACGGAGSEPADPPEAPDASSRLAREWVVLFDTHSQREADERLQSLRKAWLDRVVTWDVEVIRPFCRAGECNVRAFDFARLPERAAVALGGALPRLVLSPGQDTALLAACQGHDPHCVARVQGRITVLPEDTDAPLAIELEGVHLLSTRAARTAERFGRPARTSPRRHVADPLRPEQRS